MDKSTLKRLAALEQAKAAPPGGRAHFKPSGCPHEDARQYRAVIDDGSPVPAQFHRITPTEARRAYTEIMR